MLDRFLDEFLGAWPPPSPTSVAVATSPLRQRPGWDGVVRPLIGVSGAAGTVVSVAPDLQSKVEAAVEGVADAADGDAIAGSLRAAGFDAGAAIFRWAESVPDLGATGTWLPADDPGLPDWLRPFGGEVLVELDEDGRYLAGVGFKRHLPSGIELSVGTEPAARGKGLARRLVATAARHVLGLGAVPLYLHDPSNHASAKVADAAGFPERGWRWVELAP